MVASVLLKGMNPGNGTPFGAVRLPSTGSELRASAGDSFMLNDRWDSDTQASDRAMEEFYDPWYDRMEAANSGFDRTSIYNQSARWFNEPSPSLGNRIAYNKLEAKHAYMADQAEKMGEAFPDFEGLYNQAGKRGLEIASTAYEKFLMDMQYTQSTSPRLQAAAGSVGPAITDPLVLGSIAVTLPLGISVIAARTIAMEAGIAALTEIPIQAQRSDWYRKQGRELTTDEMVLNIVLAAGTAGLIGGGVSKIYKWAGGTNQRIMPTFDAGPAQHVKDVNTIREFQGRGAWVDWEGDGNMYWDTPNFVQTPQPDSSAPVRWMNLEDPISGGYVDRRLAGEYKVTGLDAAPVPVGAGTSGIFPADPRLAIKYDVELDHAYPLTGPHRNFAVGFIQEERMFEMNPTLGQNLEFTAQRIDNYAYMLDSIYLKEASVADLQKAVEALTRGQVPDPKQTKGLALHLNVTDVSKRVTDIKSVLGAGQKISGKSKAYRALRLNVFKEAWEAKWRKLIDEVRTRYPEGSPAPTRKVQKPKQTRKQAEQSQKQASTALDKTQEALDEAIVLEKEWRKKYGNFKRRKDPTDKEIAAMNAEGQKIFNKKTKAQKAVEDAEKRYEDSSERMFKHDAYDTESLEIEKVRAALEADRILGMISEGKTPKGKMVAGLFKQIDEAFEAARKAVKAEELLLDDLPNGLPIFSKEGPIKEAAYDYVKLLDNSTNSNKLLAQIDETSLARFDDLADDAIADFTEAGVPIKKATVAKDFEEMDTVEEAMKVCGNPKVEVVS